jgi:hypothetical protein
LLDCWWIFGDPYPKAPPPEYHGDYSTSSARVNQMKMFCISRHHLGFTNALFLDWSVRKIGLKELWALEWSREFDTAGPWTKAGGVRPEDWPPWMQNFKDY